MGSLLVAECSRCYWIKEMGTSVSNTLLQERIIANFLHEDEISEDGELLRERLVALVGK